MPPTGPLRPAVESTQWSAIFSPRETVRLISERKRAARKTKVQPSPIQRAERAIKKSLQNLPKHNPKYRTRAYERAIDRAATEITGAEGLDVARVVLFAEAKLRVLAYAIRR